MIFLIILALSMIVPETLGQVIARAIRRANKRAALRRYLRRYNHYPSSFNF